MFFVHFPSLRTLVVCRLWRVNRIRVPGSAKTEGPHHSTDPFYGLLCLCVCAFMFFFVVARSI